jgi:hypothetical protein
MVRCGKKRKIKHRESDIEKRTKKGTEEDKREKKSEKDKRKNG